MPAGRLVRVSKRRKYKKAKPSPYNNVSTKFRIMPKQFKTKLRYVFDQTLDPATGGTATLNIRGNSLFDPEEAVGGTQPRGFDEMMVFYQRYYVVSSKLRVYAFNNSTSSASAVMMSIIATTEVSTSLATIKSLLELSGNKIRWVGTSDGRGPVALSHQASTKRMLGLKDLVDNEECSGLVGTNPSREWFFRVGVAAKDSGEDPAGIDVVCVIDYDVIFTDRNNLDAS